MDRRTDVLHVGGLNYASEKDIVERVLERRPGVVSVEANPASQTATITYDPTRTSLRDLKAWIEDASRHLGRGGLHRPAPLLDGADPDAHGEVG